MPYITLHQMETGRQLGTPDYSPAKEDRLEYALEHHVSCDMLKMLDDLPVEAFEIGESTRIDIVVMQT